MRLTWQAKKGETNPPRRQRLAKVLENYGVRVQKSVFECRLDEGRFLKLKKEVDKLLDPGQDSIRYYFLCRRCRTAIEVRGGGTVREEEEWSSSDSQGHKCERHQPNPAGGLST